MQSIKLQLLKNGILANLWTICSETAPYCDVELTPRWDYDFEGSSINCKNKREVTMRLVPVT